MGIAEEGFDAECFVKPVMLGELSSVVEAGLSFVENEQPLAVSREQHEVGFPMARGLAAFDLNRPFFNRAPLFDEAGGAAAWPLAATSSEFVAWQQAMPVILLSRAVIDETID